MCLFFEDKLIAQNTKPFNIYVMSNRYDEKTTQYIKSNGKVFRYYNFMGAFYIDPNKREVFDKEQIKKGLDRMFPGGKANGFLCLDWEGACYQDLKNSDKGSPELARAVRQFRELVLFVKNLRPNVKVGIYGLPFKINSESQMKFNANNKFDEILSLCDYISPSIYLSSPDKQLGKSENEKFLKRNLDIALETGNRLRKPVIPYFWYRVHPSNKSYGNWIISQDEMERYLRIIRDYSFNGRRVEGVIWWEPSDASNKKASSGKQSVLNRASSARVDDKNSILSKYTDFLTK